MTVTVLLPAYDEADAIGPLIGEIRGAIADRLGEWEILVVDDGSTDGTSEQAAAAGARVLRESKNCGYGHAVKAGIAAANGALVVLIDADASYDPADIPRLLAAMFEPSPPGAEQVEVAMVNAIRIGERGPWPNPRWLVKGFVCKLAEWVCVRRIPDLNTGLRVFRRNVMLRYLWVLPDRFSCSTSMTLAMLCNGHPVRDVEVKYRPRVGRSKFHRVWDTIRYLTAVPRVAMYFRPLRIFLPLAILFGLVAAAKASHSVLTSSTGLHDTEVLLAVFAVAMLAVGLLADLTVAQRRR